MMRARTSRKPRGVSLIEGLMSTVILLIGMVGILQGLAFASIQNSMANRYSRASVIAQQLISAIEQQGRANLTPAAGLFGTACVASIPGTVSAYSGDLTPLPPSLASQGFTAAQMCFIDFDAASASFRSLTPGYTTQDDTTYQRLVVVYRHPSIPDVIYVGVNVGWRDGGRVRIIKRFTALYDTATNQTNLDF
jgi:Tfp pilus assembly protein PilV